MVEKLREVLEEIQGMLADGKLPDTKGYDWIRLCKVYDGAINASPCPCESGTPYSDCCKQEWNAAKRGVDKLKTEQMEAKREAVKEERAKEKGGGEIDWVIRIGMGPEGTPKLEPQGEWAEAHPYQLAGIVLSAYHGIMAQAGMNMFGSMQNAVTTIAKRVGMGKAIGG
jgi:hypothetical protein